MITMNVPNLWQDFDRPFASLASWRPLFRQRNDFFNEKSGYPTRSDELSIAPACDVREEDDHYILSFDMPGLDKTAIDIELIGNLLFVSGERKAERDEEKARTQLGERRYRKYARTVAVPDGVQADQIDAQCENGVLTIAVPKPSSAKVTKIKIGEGKSGFFNKPLGSETKKSEAELAKKEQSKVRAAG